MATTNTSSTSPPPGTTTTPEETGATTTTEIPDTINSITSHPDAETPPLGGASSTRDVPSGSTSSRYPPIEFDFLDTIQPSDLYLPDGDVDSFFTTTISPLSNGTVSLCLNVGKSNVTANISVAHNLCAGGNEEVTQEFSDSDLWAENEHFAETVIPAMVFVGLLMVIGILGNLLVVYVYGFRFKSATQHFLIVCLACFDLLMGALAMPTEIADMRYHHTFDSAFACKLLRFITMFSSISSSFTLVTIAVDRHKRVTRPLTKQMAMRKAKVWEVINVLAALFFSWPTLVLTGLRTSETRVPDLLGTDCSFSDEYRFTKFPLVYNVVLGTGFLTLITIIGVLYFRIWKTVKGHRVHMSKIPRSSQSGTSAYEIRKEEIDVGASAREGNLSRPEGNPYCVLSRNSGGMMDQDLSPQLSIQTADSPLSPRTARAICDVTEVVGEKNGESDNDSRLLQLVLTNGKDRNATALFTKPKRSTKKRGTASMKERNFKLGDVITCSNCHQTLDKCGVFCAPQLKKKKATSLKLPPKSYQAQDSNLLPHKQHPATPAPVMASPAVTSSPSLSYKSLKGSPMLRARALNPQNSLSLSIKSEDLRPMSSLLDSVSKSLADSSKMSALTTMLPTLDGHCEEMASGPNVSTAVPCLGTVSSTGGREIVSDRHGLTLDGNRNVSSLSTDVSLEEPIEEEQSGDETSSDFVRFQHSPNDSIGNGPCQCVGPKREAATAAVFCQRHHLEVIVDDNETSDTNNEEIDDISQLSPIQRDRYEIRNTSGGNTDESFKDNITQRKCLCSAKDDIDICTCSQPHNNAVHLLQAESERNAAGSNRFSVTGSLPEVSPANGISAAQSFSSFQQKSLPMAIPERFREEFKEQVFASPSDLYKNNGQENNSCNDLSDPIGSQRIEFTRTGFTRTGFDSPIAQSPNPNRRSTSPSVLENCRIKSGSMASLDNLTMSRGKNKSESRRIDKTTVVAFAVSSVFVLSFVPYLTLMFVRAFIKDFDYNLDGAALWLYNIFVRFYFLNSALNPILYGLLNERFRQECRRLLRCCGNNKKTDDCV
ncbi:uncharacterized protein LOC101848449 [Aplysia californica]|uniref:Uncharacterized protein LOC101848449 n=1 Tax=Aplysia californica TaxID=6500 RepID=A0ABM0JXK4_APLCA|nr:uncharacterized protein LOC101848449 [Aplysia californica]